MPDQSKYEEAAELLYYHRKKKDHDIASGLFKMMLALAGPKTIDKINDHVSLLEQSRGPINPDKYKQGRR
jgi:hypothetical protein